MAIKLFAHVLRVATADAAPHASAAAHSLDLRRWVFRQLVVRRADMAAWGLSLPGRASDGEAARRVGAAEPLWADTQPWCHE